MIRSKPGSVALLGGDVLFSRQVLQEAGAAAQGMVVAVPWHPTLPTNRPFAQAAEKLWRGQVSWRTALAYDATLVFLQAMAASPNSINRASLLKTLNQPSFAVANGASGRITFLPSGDRDGANVLVRVEPGSRSGTGFDFVPLVAP